jgi:hypothetical protein
MTTQARLRSILERGNLTVSDLARWLDRPWATVNSWVNEGREPTGTVMDLAYLKAELKHLEHRIKMGEGFPVPSLSQSERAAYLLKARSHRQRAPSL